MNEDFKPNLEDFEIDFENVPPKIVTAYFDKLDLIQLQAWSESFCKILDLKLTCNIHTLDKKQMMIVCSQILVYHDTLLELEKRIL
jgi:hypothetical protein